MQMKIIGIGGLPRSGKDMLAEFLMDNGYFGVSFGDITRENARKRHADKPDPLSVANMTETSNWMRQTGGPDVILKEALKLFEEAQKQRDYKGVVLFSVRAPVEVDFILARGGELIWIEADDAVRYQRYLANLRPGEAKISLEELKQQEALQWQPQPGVPKEVQMNIAYVKDHATKTLVNNGNDLAAFQTEIQEILRDYLS